MSSRTSLLLLLACSACASSHGAHRDGGLDADAAVADAGDSSIADSARVDSTAGDSGADAGDSGVTDSGRLDAGPQDCSEINGFRRCDRCAEPCPPRSPGSPYILGCADTLGVCIDRHTWEDGTKGSDGCRFSRSYLSPAAYCSVDDVCAVSGGDGTSDSAYGGLCMPADFCVEALDHPDLPDFQCLYSDGTPVLTGPPAVTCPSNIADEEPYCGGACAGVECPLTLFTHYAGDMFPEQHRLSCLGLSDARGFGVCAYKSVVRSSTDFQKRSALEGCARDQGAPCALMTFNTAAPGFLDSAAVIRLDVCRDYRSRNPSTIECRRQDWTAIVP